MRKPFPIVLLAAAAMGLLAAPARADIVIDKPWARATVPGATVAAGYLTIRNTGSSERKLLRLTSPVTDRVMVHRSSIDAEGVARMWPVATLQLGPGESVTLAPSGLHLMFTDLKAPFVAGQKVPVSFQFDGGAEVVTALLEVRPLVEADPPPAGKEHAHHH